MLIFFLQILEHGLLFSIVALGVYITFRILNFPDLTVDSSFTLGAAIVAITLIQGMNPFFALFFASIAGAIAGFFTGILHTRLKITPLLAGIITMVGLYSINLRIMGRPNIPLFGVKNTIIDIFEKIPLRRELAVLLGSFLILIFLKILLDLFFKTEFGLTIRATGDNEEMAKTQGINPDITKIVGISLSNGLVAFSGGLFAQYQGFADIGMGIGMIIIGLAMVIIGETIFRKKGIEMATLAVILGAVVYRFIVALALKYGYNIGFRPTDLKLITAILVILALSAPFLRSKKKGVFINHKKNA